MQLYRVYLLYRLGRLDETWTSLPAFQVTYCSQKRRFRLAVCVLMPTFCFWSSRAVRPEIRVKFLTCLVIFRRAYWKSFSAAPYSHCWWCTLIRCEGTLGPRMHRCVPRTKVIEILILAYPHVLVYGCCLFVARKSHEENIDVVNQITVSCNKEW